MSGVAVSNRVTREDLAEWDEVDGVARPAEVEIAEDMLAAAVGRVVKTRDDRTKPLEPDSNGHHWLPGEPL